MPQTSRRSSSEICVSTMVTTHPGELHQPIFFQIFLSLDSLAIGFWSYGDAQLLAQYSKRVSKLQSDHVSRRQQREENRKNSADGRSPRASSAGQYPRPRNTCSRVILSPSACWRRWPFFCHPPSPFIFVVSLFFSYLRSREVRV